MPIVSTEKTKTAFDSHKKFIDATALSFTTPDTRLSLMIDTSDFVVGTAFQHFIGSAVEPLGVFSKKLSASERRYNNFDFELFVIYLAVKYFRYMLEGRYVVLRRLMSRREKCLMTTRIGNFLLAQLWKAHDCTSTDVPLKPALNLTLT
ncbi:retrovirus-related Pol polyprotein from transposon opus [Nephila pilipes]|uniref:Retrovirus-related Pol polyprotein from transposon opus n=1 Tax=Nephila pilipes TaxID=299642 RepID=A0A8X6MZX8_NEPPI|nr:retrovirus-related Pol polyprotein from transposon opus [Nephila pilipes]